MVANGDYLSPMAKAEREAKLGPIGRRVRERREEIDLTQEQLADRASVSKSFISEVENGATAASGLVYLRLAQALDVPVQWVLTGESDEPRETGPVTVPPHVSKIADEMGWSHRRTLDVAAAIGAIVARRTHDGRSRELDREAILSIAAAVPDEDKG